MDQSGHGEVLSMIVICIIKLWACCMIFDYLYFVAACVDSYQLLSSLVDKDESVSNCNIYRPYLTCHEF